MKCLTEAHIELIMPPLTIMYIGNSCECCNSNIFIPATCELASTIDTTIQKYFFVAFNAQYQNITKYGMWFELQLETLTKRRRLCCHKAIWIPSNGS